MSRSMPTGFGAATGRVVALAISLAFVSAAAAQQEPASFDRDQLEELALANNPTIAQASAAYRAAVGERLQAQLRPNPAIGYEGHEIAFKRPGESTTHMFFVEQPILLGGKRRQRTEVAAREEDLAGIEVEARKLRVLTDVRAHYYAALAADRRVDVRTRLTGLAEQAVEITRQLMNTGAAARPDLLEAQIQARRAGLDLERARAQRSRVRSQLAAVVGVGEVAAASLEGSLETEIPRLEFSALLADIFERSPQTELGHKDLERAEAVVRSARAEGKPDLSLLGGFGWNSDRLDVGVEAVGWQAQFGVRLELPVSDRNQGNIAAALAMRELAVDEIRRIELTIRSRLAQVFALYEEGREAVTVYRDEILPAANEAYELFVASHQRMAASFPQVLIAQRTLFQAEQEYIEALGETWVAIATIEGLLLDDGLAAPSFLPGSVTPSASGHQ